MYRIKLLPTFSSISIVVSAHIGNFLQNRSHLMINILYLCIKFFFSIEDDLLLDLLNEDQHKEHWWGGGGGGGGGGGLSNKDSQNDFVMYNKHTNRQKGRQICVSRQVTCAPMYLACC